MTNELDKLRAENAELRKQLEGYTQVCTAEMQDANRRLSQRCFELEERLAEAEKSVRQLEHSKAASAMVMARQGKEWSDKMTEKLARTEALLAEWVAWGKKLRVEYICDGGTLGIVQQHMPPMPKESCNV